MTVDDLKRYMALCGAEHPGPLGVPWRERPLGDAALGVRATCIKSYYLDLTTRENVNGPLRAALSERRPGQQPRPGPLVAGAPHYLRRLQPAVTGCLVEEAPAHAP